MYYEPDLYELPIVFNETFFIYDQWFNEVQILKLLFKFIAKPCTCVNKPYYPL